MNLVYTGKNLKCLTDSLRGFTKDKDYEIICENGGGHFVYNDDNNVESSVFEGNTDTVRDIMKDCFTIIDVNDDIDDNDYEENSEDCGNTKVKHGNYYNIENCSFVNEKPDNETLKDLIKVLEINSKATLGIVELIKGDKNPPLLVCK